MPSSPLLHTLSRASWSREAFHYRYSLVSICFADGAGEDESLLVWAGAWVDQSHWQAREHPVGSLSPGGFLL